MRWPWTQHGCNDTHSFDNIEQFKTKQNTVKIGTQRILVQSPNSLSPPPVMDPSIAPLQQNGVEAIEMGLFTDNSDGMLLLS